jgi:two-component system alkaline phosphatase synthesis response regulator PhoP
MSNRDELIRVLVVDDEQAIRYAITKTLQKSGYWVNEASSAEDALRLLQEAEYDVVLTDIRMAGLSGVDLLAQVRDLYPDTSVILMTGYAHLNTAVESLRLGAKDYLIKPSTNRDIRESVAKGAAHAKAMRHRRHLLEVIQTSVHELNQISPKSAPPTAAPMHSIEAAAKSDSTPAMSSLAAMELGPLTLYPGRYQIAVGGKIIDLTPTEFDLLLYLAAHRGRVVPCTELVREVRNYVVDEAEAREVIRPHVSNLRRKIKVYSDDEIDLIVNVRGIGYRLQEMD